MPTLCSPPIVSRFGSVLPSIKVSPGRSSCPSCRIDATTCAGHPWYATAQFSKMMRLLALQACARARAVRRYHVQCRR